MREAGDRKYWFLHKLAAETSGIFDSNLYAVSCKRFEVMGKDLVDHDFRIGRIHHFDGTIHRQESTAPVERIKACISDRPPINKLAAQCERIFQPRRSWEFPSLWTDSPQFRSCKM